MGIGAINISSAAAGTVATTPSASPAKDSTQISPQQVAAASQVAAAKASEKPGQDEKTRTIQKPARPEAGFSANQDEEHQAQGDSEETKTEALKANRENYRKGLNVTV